jgi:hypothetical protein
MSRLLLGCHERIQPHVVANTQNITVNRPCAIHEHCRKDAWPPLSDGQARHKSSECENGQKVLIGGGWPCAMHEGLWSARNKYDAGSIVELSSGLRVHYTTAHI